MDQPHLHITPGLALRSDNIPAAFSAHSDLPPVTVKLLRLQYDGYLRAGDSGRASRRDPFVTKQSKSWHSRCHHPRFTDEPAVTKSEIFVAPTVAEAKAALGIGTTRLYELLTSGRLRARKLGNTTLIEAESMQELVKSLPLGKFTTHARQMAARSKNLHPHRGDDSPGAM